MKILLHGIAAAWLISLSACGTTIIVDGFKIDQEHYQEQRTSLLKRAAFDLNCSQEQLKLTVLAVDVGYLEQVGVAGCDQRGTYAYVWPDKMWLLNATNGQPVPKEQAPHQ